MNSYLDTFIPIDSAYMDWNDPDFPPEDEYEYDENGYIIECPNDKYNKKENHEQKTT